MSNPFMIVVDCKFAKEKEINQTLHNIEQQTENIKFDVIVYMMNQEQEIHQVVLDKYKKIEIRQVLDEQSIVGNLVMYIEAGGMYSPSYLKKVAAYQEQNKENFSIMITKMSHSALMLEKAHDANDLVEGNYQVDLIEDACLLEVGLSDLIIKVKDNAFTTIKDYVEATKDYFSVDQQLMGSMQLGVVVGVEKYTHRLAKRSYHINQIEDIEQLIQQWEINYQYIPKTSQVRVGYMLGCIVKEYTEPLNINDKLYNILQKIEDKNLLQMNPSMVIRTLLMKLKYRHHFEQQMHIHNTSNKGTVYLRDEQLFEINQPLARIKFHQNRVLLEAIDATKIEKADAYLFTLVLTNQNGTRYLEDTIRTIVKQKIGFEENIQLIIVDHIGIQDKQKMYEKYFDAYPHNIEYYYEKDANLNAMRNKGIKHAKGKYMSFLDADECFNQSILKEVATFLEVHDQEVDVVTLPSYTHQSNDKNDDADRALNETRVIDLRKEYDKIHLCLSNTFLRTSVVKAYRFDERFSYLEDILFINQILCRRLKLGVVAQRAYFYKRYEKDDLIEAYKQRGMAWYLDTLKYGYLPLIHQYQQHLGYVPKFIQSVLMHHLNCKITTNDLELSLNTPQKEEFLMLMEQMISFIDEDIIFDGKNSNIWHKLYTLKQKSEENFHRYTHLRKAKSTATYYYKDIKLWDSTQCVATIEKIKSQGRDLQIEGYIESPVEPILYRTYIVVGEEEFLLDPYKRPDKDIYIHDSKCFEREGFKVKIRLTKELQQANIKIKIDTGEMVFYPELYIDYNISMLNSYMDYSYIIRGNYIFIYLHNQLTMMKKSLKNVLGREMNFLRELRRNRGWKVCVIRAWMSGLKCVCSEDICLFIDSVDKADGHAEALYQYAVKQAGQKKKYFVVDKKSKDYKHLKKIGKVIEYNSRKHKFLMVLAQNVISSDEDDAVRNHFSSRDDYLRTLQTFKFTFLQHSITQNDR